MKSIIVQKFKNMMNNPTKRNLLGYSFKNIRTTSGIHDSLDKKLVGLVYFFLNISKML
jgi:hypothetical protein